MSQATYNQNYNDLQASIIAADFAYKKEEIKLNDKPMFSKNELDALKERWIVYCGLSFVAGLGLAFILYHL